MALGSFFNKFYQRIKNILHGVQALLIFVAAMITIALFTKSGQSDTRITYYFVLCLICIPFLIYQTAFPTFRKLRKLANAYVHAVLDVLSTILWLAAFVAEITWANDGTKAAKDFKSGDSTCQVFGYGSTDKCHLGQITTIFGIVICVLFALTTAFSTYGLVHYRKTGHLPGHTPLSIDPNTGKGDDLEFTGASPHAYDVLHAQQEMQEQEQQHEHEQEQQQQQQQQQQQARQQPPPTLPFININHHNDDNNDLNADSPPPTPASEFHATLPPRPLYPPAPSHSPRHSSFFDPPAPTNNAYNNNNNFNNNNSSSNNNFLHASTHFPTTSPSPYASPTQRPSSYEGYVNESGDYSLPPSPDPRRVDLSGLEVDDRPRPRIGGVGGGRGWSNFGARGNGGEVAFPAGDYGR